MNLSEKIKGSLYGMALGDALGLGNEFMTRNEVKMYYPKGLRHFSQMIRDAHRSMFRRGEWTNDTEVCLRLFECLISNGKFDIIELATTMKEWYDEGPADISAVMRRVMSSPEWADAPVTVSHRTWRDNRNLEASNEAMIRAIVTGMTSPRRELFSHTAQLVQSTHDDTRCIASACMVALVAYSLLHHDTVPDIDQLLDLCEAIDTRTIPYIEMAYNGDITDLKLDDEDTMTFTRKSMAAALWSVWHCDNAEDAIFKVMDQAGDADTNAACAGALAGLRFGYDALPEEKTLLIRSDYLDDLSGRLEKHIAEHVL